MAAEGAISLHLGSRTPSDDLAGYLVLRGEGAAMPHCSRSRRRRSSRRASWIATVMAGMRYVYAVVAVDSRVPLPNASEPSARVEETAR